MPSSLITNSFRLTYLHLISLFKCFVYLLRCFKKTLHSPLCSKKTSRRSDDLRVIRVPGLGSSSSYLSPYGSSHDRACELFYYIKGGVVDYGQDHSSKYGHFRFGKRFPGVFPEWSASRPIVLLSHSHGGNTCRMLQYLLHHQHFTSSDTTNASWIRAICCVASPLRGCPMLHRLGMPRTNPQRTGPWYSLVRIGQTLGYTLYLLFGSSRFYRWGLKKWDLRLWRDLFCIWKGNHRVLNTNDTAGYELTPDGAHELNRVLNVLYDCTYYISFPCVYVCEDSFVSLGSTVAFWMLFVGVACDEKSDLMVPVRSQVLSPCVYVVATGEGRCLLSKGKVWNVMRVHECDHFESYNQVMMMRNSCISSGSSSNDGGVMLWHSIDRVLREIQRNHLLELSN